MFTTPSQVIAALRAPLEAAGIDVQTAKMGLHTRGAPPRITFVMTLGVIDATTLNNPRLNSTITYEYQAHCWGGNEDGAHELVRKLVQVLRRVASVRIGVLDPTDASGGPNANGFTVVVPFQVPVHLLADTELVTAPINRFDVHGVAGPGELKLPDTTIPKP